MLIHHVAAVVRDFDSPKRLFEVLGLKLRKPHQEDLFSCEELAVECGPAELTFVRAPRTILDSYHSGCGW